MEEYIENVKLNLTYYEGKDLYSDGDIEDEILEIVKKSNLDNVHKIIEDNNKWPILYHLSPKRANIIEWIPIQKNESVLEIGAGCGAITGKLAELANDVTCIELSKKRSLINAHRNKDKDNIEIIVGNFQDIEIKIEKKYNYITLIGVYEYAEAYITSQNPYLDFLKNIKSHLIEGGKIIIAIENRLGLKYWAGCKEDHTGKYFEGIEGYPDSKGVKTFSKNEIEDLLKKAGLKKYHFYYPYPDYKLPDIVYSDDYLPKKGDLNNNLKNFDMDRMITFNEERVYNSLIENNLFTLFSNSYLIIIEKEDL
ncbi:class I SAM-dependent methyltransferase [Romboutsia lituseburensis]|uniref:class I SAM-dependent methyltransferase n=1 Tax=Romboutsia lituseburensis TaxID=1537 RepID=UPI00215AF288|nr:class I SAM-dependent methyltransferase [Romboutsia lituseburensis]MCR8745455.1 class I SAM-dependent methyltransferase [Romboutsia lituseburensis]